MTKVIILMKSGREISTTHDWEDMKSIINEDTNDPEMVVQGVINGETQWVAVKKNSIEGYRNL